MILHKSSGHNEAETNGSLRQIGEELTDKVNICINDNNIVARSQIYDYLHRGPEVEHMNILDFVKNTYEQRTTFQVQELTRDDVIPDATPQTQQGRGRPPHARVRYMEKHSHYMTACRVIRPVVHKMLLSIPGKWFPRNNDPERYDLYCASMLALLRPWRTINDIEQTSIIYAMHSINSYRRLLNA